MGAVTLRFKARLKTSGKGSLYDAVGWGNGGTGPVTTNEHPSRHCPLMFFKGGNAVGCLAGVNNDTTNDAANAHWLVPEVSFADWGYTGNATSTGLLVGTDLPARLAIEMRTTAGVLVFSLSGAELVQTEIASLNAGVYIDSYGEDDILQVKQQCLFGTYTSSGNTTLVAGTEYDMTIKGDFDRVDIIDHRAFQNGRVDWSAIESSNSIDKLYSGIDTGKSFPELRLSALSGPQSVDFPDFYAGTYDQGGVGAGASPIAGVSYYTRVYRTLDEAGNTISETAGFNALNGDEYDQAWGVYTQNAGGINTERYIYVNGDPALTGADENFRDGKSKFSGFETIADITPAPSHNDLVYVVAGTIVNGSALTNDTVFAVNDGVVAIGGSPTGTPRANITIPLGNAQATSSTFTLAPSQSRRYYTAPELAFGEFVTAEVLGESGYESLGILINQNLDSGVLTNNSTQTQTYRITKSFTQSETRVEYD